MDSTIKLASDIADFCEKGNSVYPSDTVRLELRESYLLQARASLMALDVKMADIYLVLRQNPQGAFVTEGEKLKEPPQAMGRIQTMSQTLGEMIDRENGYITSLLKSDKQRGLLDPASETPKQTKQRSGRTQEAPRRDQSQGRDKCNPVAQKAPYGSPSTKTTTQLCFE
ncbi:MAG: hypothetical protein IJU76_14210 [Desulfovibrionaceae bacterium]|nr:hypothetical protein [Desulfovibrionaceae bacterium]